jgi:hypothetical protein
MWQDGSNPRSAAMAVTNEKIALTLVRVPLLLVA